MIVEDLKKSIFNYALMGKLTHNLNYDGLKEKLFIDNKLPSIKKEEIPFEIPDGWFWERIGNLGASIDTNSFADGPFGSNLKTEHYINEPEVRIIQLSNIGDDGWIDDNVKYTSYEHLKTIARCEVKPGDFVIAKMMPAGRPIIIPDLGTKITLGSDAVKFVPNPILNKKYLLYAIKSPMFIKQVYSEVHGITRVRTSLNKFKNYLIPIPPLKEQQEIIDRIDDIFNKLDDIKPIEEELEMIKLKFSDNIKSSILNAAIKGMLTKQDVQDKASELILKSNLKSCKSSKDDIPENWEMLYINDIFEIKNGYSFKSNLYVEDGIRVIRITNVQKNSIVDPKPVFYPKELVEEKYILRENDILLSLTGNVGRVARLTKEFLPAALNQRVGCLRPKLSIIDEDYLFIVLNSQLFESACINSSKGLAQKNMSTEWLKKYKIPIPPLEEQQRIVEKVNSLLPLCDDVERLVKQ